MLVTATASGQTGTATNNALAGFSSATADVLKAGNSGIGTAFIGGGCCVHLSVEFAPITPTAEATVIILVKDTEGTGMAWEKQEKAGTHYQVKECVITTKPGATLTVAVLNMTARVRWCEIFSC